MERALTHSHDIEWPRGRRNITVEIHTAKSDTEIAACYPVMAELRPHLAEETFVERVRSQERQGYRLAYLTDPSAPVAVAGFRIGESLAWGRYLYVDDLVTASNQRSRGYGTALLSWLTEFAAEAGCHQLHLDSGIQRKEAHRFYEREGMQTASYHFVKTVVPGTAG